MNKNVSQISLLDATEVDDAPVDRGALLPRSSVEATSVVSLFAGIGGFDLAFSKAGAKISYHSEVDRFCQAVLRRHWPDVPLNTDIRTLQAAELPDAQVWTAGFPCQDVSLARGNHGRSGLRGNHTSLFFELVRLLDKKKPEVILLENVVGLLNSHRGADFAVVVKSLIDLGYGVAWRVLNARYFGTPQSRSRVFLVAWYGDERKAVQALYEPIPARKGLGERTGFVTETRHPRNGAIVPEMAYCVAATSGRHTGNDWSRSYISYDDRVRRPTPTESERLQGFPAGWTEPPSSFRIPARGVDSERYRAAGNAVAVPVVEWIAGRIMAILKGEKVSAEPGHRDIRALAPDLAPAARECNLEQILEGFEAGLCEHRWKSGGVATAGFLHEANAPSSPVTPVKTRFVDLLDEQTPNQTYFLTRNAAAGIIRRADQVKRNLFPPMRAALERMLESSGDAGQTGDDTVKGGFVVGTSHGPLGTSQHGDIATDR